MTGGQPTRGRLPRRTGLLLTLTASLLLSGCSAASLGLAPGPGPAVVASVAPVPATRDREEAFQPLAYAPSAGSSHVNGLIGKYASIYDVPESLVHRVVRRESSYNPSARNGAYYGLMQISYATARTMGYQGPPAGLLDAETNLKYAVKYLRGAWITAGYNADGAVRFYSRGYYYDAKAKGLLEVTGLR